MDYSLWGRKESDTTERLSMHSCKTHQKQRKKSKFTSLRMLRWGLNPLSLALESVSGVRLPP